MRYSERGGEKRRILILNLELILYGSNTTPGTTGSGDY